MQIFKKVITPKKVEFKNINKQVKVISQIKMTAIV